MDIRKDQADQQPQPKTGVDQAQPEVAPQIRTGRPGNHHKLAIAVIFFLIVAILAGAAYFVWRKVGDSDKSTSSNKNQGVKSVSIPQKVMDNKFGFLGGGSEDKGEAIVESGAAWVRPHPGAFVWDMMQAAKSSSIDFTEADAMVAGYQSSGLAMLATIWPFAEWDQQTSAAAASCKVSDNDEFLPANDKKSRGSYLPAHRCNPSDWQSYQTWVNAIVERYDGDGVNDMPGLKIPVKYWEVMNEPDLARGAGPNGDRLTFYKQGPAEYGELLKQTYTAIKKADSKSQVLIAGAAGGQDEFLGFYQELFAKVADIKNYFDIGNVHCISNDETTHDFNVGAYKSTLAKAGITKPVWVTEAEAMYGKTADENYQNTKASTSGALAAGAERIFFTRYQFDDFRTDMSQQTADGSYPSAQKYKELIESN